MIQAITRHWYLFLLLFVLLAFILGDWGWIVLTHLQNDTHAQRAAYTTPAAERDLHAGTRLIIPSLHINAQIETVGITTNGAMGLPSTHPWQTVGWYKYGPYPGDLGSAVVDGHLNQPGGSPAIFWHLHNLHKGDEVLINNATGNTLRFQVIALKLYTPQNAPKKAIFGNYAGRFLNLITCAGPWIASQQQTSQRLVVYTRLV